MKLIIDIDEQHFEILQSAVRNGMGDNSQKIIANGIPFEYVLDEIREEIRDLRYSGGLPTALVCAYIKCLEIIDKYKTERSDKE